MSNRKLGRLPARPDARRLMLGSYLAAAQLPPPPAQSDRTGGISDWGDMLNAGDSPLVKGGAVGDCTCAGIGHMIMAWSRIASGTAVVPSDQQILTAYEAVSGYNPATGANDNGCLCTGVLEYHRTTGISGNRNVGYAAIDPRDPTALSQTVYLFGGAYIGCHPAEHGRTADRTGSGLDGPLVQLHGRRPLYPGPGVHGGLAVLRDLGPRAGDELAILRPILRRGLCRG